MKINKIYLILLAIGMSVSVLNAQSAVETLRYTELFPGGTARMVGVGGAMSSLGADFGALSANPAGLGVYRKSEFVISPALLLTNITSSLNAGEENKANNSHLGIENIGLVFYKGYDNKKLKAFNFAAGINRLVNFNRRVEYRGSTPGSIVNSFQENAQGLFENDLDPFTSGLANEAAAIFSIDGYDGEWFSDFDTFEDLAIDREETITTTGGVSEILLSLGFNIEDKLYLGGSLSAPLVRFEETREYTESDQSGDVVPFFRNLLYEQTLSTTGIGIGFKAGAIYRITNQLRVGASVHSPTRYSLSDDFSSSLNYFFIDETDPAFPLLDGSAESPPGSFDYVLRTPWRYSGGLSLVLRKFGFISLDVEVLNYASSTFDFTVDGSNSINEIAQDNENSAIQNDFQNAVNVKLGVEYLINNFRLRAGYGSYGNPFESDDPGRRVLSFGAGFRGEKVYLDVAYSNNQLDEGYEPYSVSNGFNQSVVSDIGANNFLLTFGYRF